MADANPKLLIEVSSSRDLVVRIRGTPDSLRTFAATLLSSIDDLPSPLTSQREFSQKQFGFGEANGSKRETHLSFQASPTLDVSPAKRLRHRLWDWIVIVCAVAFVAFAVVGLLTTLKWVVDHVP